MLHSSEQLKREQEYARQNKEYLENKRECLRELKRHEQNTDDEAPRKKQRMYKFCCLFAGVIFILSVYAIYYFIWNIKDSVISDYYQKKKQIEKVLPQGAAEIKKGLDQGQDLLEETGKNAIDLQNKYNQAKETVQDVQQKYDEAKQVYDNVKEIKDNVENTLKK